MRKILPLLAAAVLAAAPAPGGWNEEEDGRRYRVVINHEEQYSIWFAHLEPPDGWKDAEFRGTKKECLRHIEEVWTDMRPLSWRRGWSDWHDKDGRRYRVVINHEEQYSVWPADRETPRGWKNAGFSGDRRQALAYIEEVWTDIRPLSWRKRWDATGR